MTPLKDNLFKDFMLTHKFNFFSILKWQVFIEGV